jgi:hypothetical protein
MKKIVLFLLMLFSSQMIVQAQHVEITPFGGYVFPARWYSSNGSLYFNGNGQYGGQFAVGISRVVDIDFIYNRIDTRATPEVGAYSGDEISLSENFYMVGVTKNFRVSNLLSPYVGMHLGGVYMAPKSSEYYSYWFFAWQVDGGVKIYFSKYVGLNLKAQLMMPIQGGGFTFYYGSGGGGSGVYLTSPLLDFGFTGGLIFRIGQIR